MKKTFPLKAEGKADARVVEAIKHDIRKYVKRERKKAVPAEFEIWEFACKVGLNRDTAEDKPLGQVGVAIDVVALGGADSVYVEIIAVPARRNVPTSLPTGTSASPELPAARDASSI